jgi:hypothetical protein
MIGRELEVLVLEEPAEDGVRSAISDNFLRVRVPETLPANEWIKIEPIALTEDGLIT